MRLRALLVLALLCAAGPAHALSAILKFDGTVRFTTGSAPSLTALGLSPGTPLHFEVKVDTAAHGFTRYGGGGLTWAEDYWSSPEDHTDQFYAEMLVPPYPTPGTYYGWGNVNFAASTIVTPAYSCQPVGRLFVGPAMHLIDGCDAAIEDWQLGKGVVSWHFWHDPDTGAHVSVFTDYVLIEIVPVPEPGSTTLLASGAALLACLSRRRAARMECTG